MSAVSDKTPDAAPASASRARPRPLLWSVRRELWENQAIWIAPLCVAAVIIFGLTVAVFAPHRTSLSTVHRTSVIVAQSVAKNPSAGSTPAVAAPPSGTPTVATETVSKTPLTPAQRRALTIMPFNIVAVAMIVTMFLVSIFYCLGAMFNERRDRSILFWKSLPVPDLTTVLAKLIVPMAILPLVTVVVTVGTQLTMLLIGLATHGRDPDVAVSIPLGEMTLVLLYGLATLTLWWAPVYAWLLLVSGWAKRAPFLWAVLPPIAVAVAEKLAFNTTYVGAVIQSRLTGSFTEAFAPFDKAGVRAGALPTISLAQIDAGKFLSAPGLWVGLIVAAALLALTVWLRREREPI